MNFIGKDAPRLPKGLSWLQTQTDTASPSHVVISASDRSPTREHAKSLLELDVEANKLILNAISFDQDRVIRPKMSLSAYIPSLSGLSLSRSTSREEERGRKTEKDRSGPSSRASSLRSLSPWRRRNRAERSPSVEALRGNQSEDSDEDDDGSSKQSSRSPRNAFRDGASDSDSDEEEDDWSDHWDDETEDNTERNAIVETGLEDAEEAIADPFGEGVNVVRPDVPIFQPQPSQAPGPRRRRTLRMDALSVKTAAPHFQRDRCTVVISHGDPAGHCIGRLPRKYMVASDLSEESKYAIEWAIGTVLKDGDELTIVTVAETDVKLDPTGSHTDRLTKLRNQQERQGLAYLLVKQATALLQRTRLHVTIKCLAIHAKNARHMLLDLIDLIQPIMVIVGSRGVGRLKGILLGSTSHYLIQKSSCPVMVARRRLKRAVPHSQIPPRTKHVPLAQATIEKPGQGSTEKQVQEMRHEIAQEEASRQKKGPITMVIPPSPAASAIHPSSSSDAIDVTESSSDTDEGIDVAGK